MLAQVTGKEAISRRLPRCDRTVPTGAAATTLGSAFAFAEARSAVDVVLKYARHGGKTKRQTPTSHPSPHRLRAHTHLHTRHPRSRDGGPATPTPRARYARFVLKETMRLFDKTVLYSLGEASAGFS